jgi:hypothetical protein
VSTWTDLIIMDASQVDHSSSMALEELLKSNPDMVPAFTYILTYKNLLQLTLGIMVSMVAKAASNAW